MQDFRLDILLVYTNMIFLLTQMLQTSEYVVYISVNHLHHLKLSLDLKRLTGFKFSEAILTFIFYFDSLFCENGNCAIISRLDLFRDFIVDFGVVVKFLWNFVFVE